MTLRKSFSDHYPKRFLKTVDYLAAVDVIPASPNLFSTLAHSTIIILASCTILLQYSLPHLKRRREKTTSRLGPRFLLSRSISLAQSNIPGEICSVFFTHPILCT